VYAPGWFWIKKQTSFIAGPKILFDLLQQAKSLSDPQLYGIFIDKMQEWAFPLLSENFLASMLFSEERRDRALASMRICELKACNPEQSLIVSQRIQPVNFNAENWSQLIQLTTAECEPPCTMGLSSEEVEALVDNPVDPPKYPIHSQSVERAVKNVSESLQCGWSWEKRHRSIVAKYTARAQRPKSEVKKMKLQ